MSKKRDRVTTAILREIPDRVPLDFSANQGVQEHLRSALSLSNYHEMLTYFGSDIFDMRGIVDPEYHGEKPLKFRHNNGVFENYWGMRTRVMQTATGPEESYCEFPLAHITDPDQLARYPWPSVDDFDFSSLRSRLQDWESFAIMASGVSIFQHPSFLRGLDNLLMDFLIQPETAAFIMDRFTEFYLAYFDRLLSAAEGQITMLRIADDLGMQDRLLISPEIFREFFVPRLKQFTDMAHSHGVYVMNHSCGSIIPFISDLIEIGVDILDPIQVTAKGMDPIFLKDTFGDRICFHGGVDTQYLLPTGLPNDVRDQVRLLFNSLGTDGGYILSPSHILQTDVPIENIEALYAEGQMCHY